MVLHLEDLLPDLDPPCTMVEVEEVSQAFARLKSTCNGSPRSLV